MPPLDDEEVVDRIVTAHRRILAVQADVAPPLLRVSCRFEAEQTDGLCEVEQQVFYLQARPDLPVQAEGLHRPPALRSRRARVCLVPVPPSVFSEDE